MSAWADLDDAVFGGIGWLAVFPCLVLLIVVVPSSSRICSPLLVPLAIKLLDEH